MLERDVVAAITAYLKSRGDCWWFKSHGGAMQVAGIPDLIGVCQGRFFGLEAKAAKGKPTTLQLKTIDRIRQAGGLAAVVRSVEDVKRLLGDHSGESK